MKIYSFPFALTLESSLTIGEFELLQKYDPSALALKEATSTGEEYEYFRLGYSASNYGSVSDNGITFVGNTSNNLAGMSMLIPAALNKAEKDNYINEKLATISRNASIVEEQARKALTDVKAAKAAFLASITALVPKTEPENEGGDR